MVPSLWSIEAGLLSLHTLTLIARTFLSIYVATLEGKMVKKYDFEIFIKYSVARTPQVGKSKLQITRDEKKSQVAKCEMYQSKTFTNMLHSRPKL